MAQLHSFSLLRLKADDLVVCFLIENNSVNIVKQTEQMSLRDRETGVSKPPDSASPSKSISRHDLCVTCVLPVSCASPRLDPESPAARGQTRRKTEERPTASSPGNQTETSDRAPTAPGGEGATGGRG